MGNTPVILPQDDEQVDTRQRDLQEARGKYQLKQHTFGLSAVQQRLVNIVNIPPMVSDIQCKFTCLIIHVWSQVIHAIAILQRIYKSYKLHAIHVKGFDCSQKCLIKFLPIRGSIKKYEHFCRSS